MIGAHFHLIRWLAPGADALRVPAGIERRSVTIQPDQPNQRPFEAWLYAPVRRAARRAYLVVPGLHFLGPGDPRLDRFLRVLAGSGAVVMSPFLPDFTALRVSPDVVPDLERTLNALLNRPELPRGSRPGLFSISFGSLPALRLASSPTSSDRIGSLILFGGYADWAATIRFCLTGRIGGRRVIARDPLNQPVVFMNLLDSLPVRPAAPERLLKAWRRYVESTWGRPEMKRAGRYQAVALKVAAELDDHADRELFLRGCGVGAGTLELVEEALARTSTKFLDPRPDLGGLRCPVHLFHGLDDDVIPYTELERLARAMPDHIRVRTYLTGLYGHTGSSSIGGVTALAREGWTMLRMVRAMVSPGGLRR